MVCSACAHVLALLRYAPRHCAVHTLIHSFTYLLGLRAKEATCARVPRARVTRVFALPCSALSVCVYCGVCRPFSARGVKARPSPLAEASRKLHPNTKGRHDPTARDPIHQYTPASLPPTLRGGGLLRIPGLHRSAQSVLAPPLSSLLDLELRRTIKTPSLPARMEKLFAVDVKNDMPQTSPSGGHLATWKCRKNGRSTNTERRSIKNSKTARSKTRAVRGAERSEANRLHSEHEPQSHGAIETIRRNERTRNDSAPSPGGDEENNELQARNNQHFKVESREKGGTSQAQEQRTENREDAHVRYPQRPRRKNCVSHRRTNVV